MSLNAAVPFLIITCHYLIKVQAFLMRNSGWVPVRFTCRDRSVCASERRELVRWHECAAACGYMQLLRGINKRLGHLTFWVGESMSEKMLMISFWTEFLSLLWIISCHNQCFCGWLLWTRPSRCSHFCPFSLKMRLLPQMARENNVLPWSSSHGAGVSVWGGNE